MQQDSWDSSLPPTISHAAQHVKIVHNQLWRDDLCMCQTWWMPALQLTALGPKCTYSWRQNGLLGTPRHVASQSLQGAVGTRLLLTMSINHTRCLSVSGLFSFAPAQFLFAGQVYCQVPLHAQVTSRVMRSLISFASLQPVSVTCGLGVKRLV